jgi:glycosyltransferase involved in cell wall biosynthesis
MTASDIVRVGPLRGFGRGRECFGMIRCPSGLLDLSEKPVVRLLLITKRHNEGLLSGREILSKLYADLLVELFGADLHIHALPPRRIASVSEILSAFRGYVDGIDADEIKMILQHLRDPRCRFVFLDGSNFGALAEAIKRKRRDIVVLTFFHNVETRFFFGAFRQHPSPRALAVLAVNYLAERKSLQFSDILITLTNADRDLLGRLYGRAATHVIPMAIGERRAAKALTPRVDVDANEKHLLFVGGAFYANLAGVAWFCRTVAPQAPMKTIIVGKGMELHRIALERYGNVEVVGSVDDLSDWYAGAHCVIAPIFDGSGMKTKIAEALMYGKKVIGTPAAFVGYEACASEAGWICENEADFIETINLASKQLLPSFDPAMRALYDANYSFEAAKTRLQEVFCAAELVCGRSDESRHVSAISLPLNR